MICHDVEKDEYLWEYIPSAWYVDTNSPTSISTVGHLQLNKTHEQKEGFDATSLAGFAVNTGSSLLVDGAKTVINMNPGDLLHTQQIKIAASIPYIVMFSFRAPTSTPSLNIDFETFNEGGFPVDLENIETGAIRNFSDQGITGLVPGEYYNYKAIIYAWDEPNQSAADAATTFGGRDLRWGTPSVNKLIIKLSNPAASGGDVYIHDFKMFPLENPQAPTFINGIEYTNIWLKNNNQLYRDSVLERNIREYLIPSNAGLIINKL